MKELLKKIRDFIGDKLLAVILSQLLTKENILKGIDAILDVAEELAVKTKTDIDDNALAKIREALNVPDND